MPVFDTCLKCLLLNFTIKTKHELYLWEIYFDCLKTAELTLIRCSLSLIRIHLMQHLPFTSGYRSIKKETNDFFQKLCLRSILCASISTTMFLFRKEEPIPAITGDINFLTTELKDFCNGAPDMSTFATDAKVFFKKFEFYIKMENYHAKKLKYAENRLKESVDEATTKLYVDEIEEKIHLR